MLKKTLTTLFHPFSGTPGEMLAAFTFWTSLVWVVQTSLCQYILPLDSIEAIVWGEQLQLGQMKSPPLSGYIAYGFAWLSGYHDWGNYLAAQLCIVSGIFFTYKLAREFFDEAGSAAAALALYFLPYYMPPAMKFCSHDTQIALLPGIAFFFYLAIKNNRLRDWVAVGIVSAAAMLGKYAAGQQLIACFVCMFVFRFARKRFASCKPYLAGMVFLLLLAPHVYWLTQNDFLPLLHLEERMGNAVPWYEPLVAAGTMLFPYAVILAVMALALFIDWKAPRERTAVRGEALSYSLLMTLIPGGIYLGMTLCGKGIVMSWYSYLASLTGITAVAVFPWKFSEKAYRRMQILCWLYFAILLVAVTLDVMAKPRYRIHADPKEITALAEKACHQFQSGDIPCVYGDRWLAGVIQNYLPYRPKAFVHEDLCDIKLADKLIREKGALLVFGGKENLSFFEKHFGRPARLSITEEITCRAQFGREKKYEILFGYFPPEPKR